MINEEKIKVMTDLAMYEKTQGDKYFPISKYFRSDYLGLALIKNFFLVTIGYALVVALVGAYFSTYILDNVHRMNLINLGLYILIGYGIVFVVYTLITYITYSVKYYKAKKSVKSYFGELNKLTKMYEKEEKRMSSRSAGGYK
ncbi:MAG: hypothetical protein Q4B47_03880 [Eubacteriales bacterium]|nr:hypothetical protein [Eubacteriales bacterium]